MLILAFSLKAVLWKTYYRIFFIEGSTYTENPTYIENTTVLYSEVRRTVSAVVNFSNLPVPITSMCQASYPETKLITYLPPIRDNYIYPGI